MNATLTPADLHFINLVASRRFAGADPAEPDGPALDEAVAVGAGDDAVVAATRLLSTLISRQAFASVPEHTALLVLHASLAIRGLSLLAPQGVLVGMIRSLGRGDIPAFERWLEDRAVPSASGQ